VAGNAGADIVTAMISGSDAFDAAFTAQDQNACVVVADDGSVRRFPVARWSGEADAADLRLFVDPCTGPTIDLGCGPGRLTAALVARGQVALGIDVSAAAVMHTLRRGAPARHLDIFDALPDMGRWQHALLADGNIGIGGEPVRLLRRAREVIADDGTILAEVRPRGTGLRRGTVRLRVDGVLRPPFEWAHVGVDMIAGLAARAGLELDRVTVHGRRHVAVLRPAIGTARCS
jgi:SAM-dependent methyltransferase